VLLSHLVFHRSFTPRVAVGLLLVLISWAVSLSLGYSSPALGGGILVQMLLVWAVIDTSGKPYAATTSNWGTRQWQALGLGLIALASSVAFLRVRRDYIYREPPAAQLTAPLGDVLVGGARIRTNPRTYAVLKDLQAAKQLVGQQGNAYVILPDIAVNWATDPQRNPLSVNWPLDTELPGDLMVSTLDELDTMRGDVSVIVTKHETALLSKGFFPLQTQAYGVVRHILARWVKLTETRYFTVYG
jgi:hypothetical protein